ncbi:alpha/beta hydrolase [Halalkaliarchaeum desulfuricum]|uniref:Alpha/beta hydrolase n=1 Tax=Halalkaliarchaeum desulfuricum TaxID=2055893 RepID=A0A343TP09_9EURY|nr:alpha/beta hydrolase [Halalkaliarchaeum desulfuricum]AUX10831.1 alpha/beta hydrolase [Halalkaliarchaeum desulfuricum]
MQSYSEWSDAQESTTLTVDGQDLEVAYYEAGTGNGDPVVFLHGIPTNSYLWRHAVSTVAEEHHVVAPDMIGYGNSSKFDGFDRSLRAQEIAIDGLLADLGFDTVSLVGHDLGGGVFLRYACHEPDTVERLVLSNSVAYDSWPIQTITDLGLPESARQNSPEEIQGMLDGLFRQTLWGDDPDEAFVEGMKAPWNSEDGVTSLVRNAIATNTNHTTEVDPRNVTADTLLLWGLEDEFQPVEWAERLERDIPQCELVGLDEANHWVPEDRPDAFVDHLRTFLS